MKENGRQELKGNESIHYRRTVPESNFDESSPEEDARSRHLALTTTHKVDDTSATLQDEWNTKHLGLRLSTDLLSASCAAGIVAPVISMVDRSIMENASGRATLGASLVASLKSLVRQPLKVVFSRQFALIFILYGGTYLTANALDTATSTIRNRPATHVTSGSTKFLASSAANVGLCIYKDRCFVRMFGPAGAAPRAVPLATYALFAARDCMTIFASFNVPPLLAPFLHGRLSDEAQRYVSGLSLAQFCAPAAVQFVSTPLHLLGLDLYNRPAARKDGNRWLPTAAERYNAVKRNWVVSSAARICRIVPAFGIGGVVNIKVRHNLMEKLD